MQMIGGGRALTASEQDLASRAAELSAGDLDALGREIREGLDPLGVDFIRLRSPDARRRRGAVYTPAAIIDAMIEWASTDPGDSPARIVDPGAGSGRFLMAAARAFPDAALCAIEIDPLATLILRANATAVGFADRLTTQLGDYRTFELPPIEGRTLFIGNPPYVRHHQIDESAKQWFAAAAERFGFKASKLAGLHIHFFLRTREIATPGDFGAFVTSSEWLDVNYGAALRTLLEDGLGGTALHILDPAARPFDDAMTTAAIACFRVGARPGALSVRAVSSLDDLKPLTEGKALAWSAVAKTRRWSTLLRETAVRPAGFIELGELFSVHRGQVTGGNGVWIAGPRGAELPKHCLLPAITRAR
ncbi:MAG: N-6 DNA methylase, partial [Hyphomicrobiales bacterium]|nr:N-6 DNA methylase [Hyphomicrobiales bacterium]